MIFNNSILEIIGWTLVHSVWQISLVGIIIKLGLFIFRNKSSRIKYSITLFGIGLIVLSTIFTFSNIYTSTEIISEPHNQFPIFKTLTLNTSEISELNVEEQIPFISKALLLVKSNMSLIVYIWLIGVLFFSIRFAGSYWYVQKLKLKFSHPLNEKWDVKFKTIGKKLNLRRKVQFLESSITKIPITIGYLKPAVILPVGLLTCLPFNQIEAIITHELAHIKRNDYLINLFISFLEAFFFFHPVFWWLSKTINSERENCCDDITIINSKESNALQRALIKIHKNQINAKGIPSGKSINIAAALYKNEFQLLKRIKRMKTKNHINHGKKGTLAGFALLLTSILIFTLSSAFGPRLADLPQQYYNDLSENEINGLLPESTNYEIEPEKLPAAKPIQASIQPANKFPDSTKTKKTDRQVGVRTKDTKSNVVMEFDDDMNLLSVKENGKELQGEKRKEYEKKAQKIKTNFEQEENLEKKEAELKIIQKELEEKQQEMYKAQHAYTEASSEYFKQLYELDTINYFLFNDSLLDNAWDIFEDQNTWKILELAEMEKHLADIYQNLPENFMEPSDYELFDEEKFKDLYNDQFDKLEDTFMELEKAQKLQRAELLAQMEDLEKIEDVDRLEFEGMLLESKITEELVNDKIIKVNDELRSFRLSEKKLMVNGENQSNKLKDKYIKLYEEITGGKLEGTMQVIIED